MRIPGERSDRHALYRNLLRYAEVSRDDRKARVRRMRQWLLYGSESTSPARYNKLLEHVKASTSYLYSPSSVRFGVTYPPSEGTRWVDELDAAREELQRLWHEGAAGARPSLVFRLGVETAHWQDSVVFKVIVDRNQPALTMLSDYSDLGVLREGVDNWAAQEALAHWYPVDLSAFERLVERAIVDEKERAEVVRLAREHANPVSDSSGTLPPAMSNLILTAASPTMTGNVVDISAGSLALPREREPVVRLAELWVYDDEVRDYRVVTIFLPAEMILWERLNAELPGRHPFFPLCLNPVPGYLWGVAPIERLLQLQQWRENRMNQIDEHNKKALDPPFVATGVSGVHDEKLERLRRPGGNFSVPMPQGDVKPFIIPTPPDALTEIQEIDRMFANLGGLPAALRGEMNPNVRSGNMMMESALLGSGPTLDTAMLVEACAEDVATALLSLQRRVLARALEKADGSQFLLSQMPGNFRAKVWAHSASPLYTQQLLAKIAFAAQVGAVAGPDIIDLLDLPNREALRERAKRIEKAKAEAAATEQALRTKETEAKVIKAQAAASKVNGAP